MARHNGLIIVRFHGGFLDGQISRSDQPLGRGISNYWHPQTIYDVTAGQLGAYMSGVSPDGLSSLKDPSETSPTVVLHHRYRVTAAQLENGRLTLDVQYEYVPGGSE